jgi:DNA-binding GntR family transcriptional regulator
MYPRQRARRKSADDSLSERAYRQIRDKILRGEFPIGAALSRRKLAEEFGMSFVPISEALQRLEIDGLVESKPRAGTRVRIPSPQDVRERYMLREALETHAARVFAERAGSSDKEELCRMAQHLDQLYSCCAGADDEFLYSVHTYHMSFHLRIAAATGCTLLRDAIEREQVLVFNWLFDTAAQRRILPPSFHSDLVASLASGDVARAEEGMRQHIRYGMDEVLNALPQRQDDNGWRLHRPPIKRSNTGIAKR